MNDIVRFFSVGLLCFFWTFGPRVFRVFPRGTQLCEADGEITPDTQAVGRLRASNHLGTPFIHMYIYIYEYIFIYIHSSIFSMLYEIP